jgi:hypothetical protein
MRNEVVEVGRQDTGATRVVTEELGELGPQQVRLRVDRFAVTANTVTYAAMGDFLGYWDFFPTGDPAWGRVPAMGWADVVESAHPDVPVGGRHYGWFPMAGHVDLTVTPIPAGLRDDGAHRAKHAPVYRTLAATTADPLYPQEPDPARRGDLEDRHALLRGLFMTGYLADAFFELNGWFGAEAVVVLSASSKTAIGFADCVAAHGGIRRIGVTSAGNVGFVEGLGLYDDVVTYDAVGELPLVPSVAVDMAGNGPVLTAVHDRLGDRLGHSMVVGRTHHDTPMAQVTSGPAPQMFFAPTALEALGAAGTDTAEVLAASARALAAFVDRSQQWLRVERATGAAGTEATWADVHAGRVDPAVGRIASLHG